MYHIPAVIVGMDINGLGVARCLAPAGVPVIGVDASRRPLGMHSRHLQKAELVPALQGAQLLQGLRELGAALGQAALFITDEDALRTVSEGRDLLAAHYRFLLPGHESVLQLMHKPGVQAAAEAGGIAVPRGVAIGGEKDIAQLAGLSYPIIVKPGFKDRTYGSQFERGYKLGSPQAAEALVRRILPVLSDVIAQEWIEGEEGELFYTHVFRDENGTTLAAHSGRKVRSWPLNVGIGTCFEPAPEMATEMEALTDRFFTAAGLVGLGSTEFKREAGSGRLVLVEPSVGRTEWHEEIAALNGVNIPMVAYCHLLGLPLPPARAVARAGVWRDCWPHARAWLAGARAGFRGRHPRRIYDACWRLDDPLPGVVAYWQRATGALLRRLGNTS